MVTSQSTAPHLRVQGPLLNVSSGKSSQSLLSPWFPSAHCVHPAWDQVFLSQAHNRGLSLQTSQTPEVHTQAIHPRGVGGGLAPLLPFVGLGPREQSRDPAAVFSLWQHGAESRCLDLRFSAGFPTLMPGSSAALGPPRSSRDPGDPETMLSHLGFCPVSPPEHL